MILKPSIGNFIKRYLKADFINQPILVIKSSYILRIIVLAYQRSDRKAGR